MNCGPAASARARLKIAVRGAVQGVGFRPFVFRLAEELKLAGWVNNSPQGVFIEVEGLRPALEKFLLRLEAEKPPRSFIQSLESSWLDAIGCKTFEIRESETGGGKTALVMPDIATCPDCLREIFDPQNRRHRYPFTNCTNCGPRFSIIESLPYDRANTSMRQFAMCPACQAEYDDPRDRRFHAQPNACPACGPRLELWRSGVGRTPIFRGAKSAALYRAQLRRLARRRRGHPFRQNRRRQRYWRISFNGGRAQRSRCQTPPRAEASRGETVRADVSIVGQRKIRLRSFAAGKTTASFARSADCFAAPSRAISNFKFQISNCRWCRARQSQSRRDAAVESAASFADGGTGFSRHRHERQFERRADLHRRTGGLERLGGIADVFLVHNRPIVRHVDDSIVRVMLGREMVLRRARGYAPLPISVRIADWSRNEKVARNCSAFRIPQSEIILAVGAHLKNAVALSVGKQVFISQHIGDLETEPANAAFRRVIADFEKLYDAKPEIIAADLHPDYLSTKFALERRSPARRGPENSPDQRAGSETGAPKIVQVQHHIAHVLSCMAENEIGPPALGVSWDGTGYGLDGTIWGGEFFQIADGHIERIAHLRPFRLPGGDKAVREPRRPAIGLLYEMFGDAVFPRKDWPPVAGLHTNGTGRPENDARKKSEFAGHVEHGPAV